MRKNRRNFEKNKTKVLQSNSEKNWLKFYNASDKILRKTGSSVSNREEKKIIFRTCDKTAEYESQKRKLRRGQRVKNLKI